MVATLPGEQSGAATLVVPVALIEADPTLRVQLAKLCDATISVASTGALDARLASIGRAVFVFGPSFADDIGLADAGQTIAVHNPASSVLLVATYSDALARRAVAVGFGEMFDMSNAADVGVHMAEIVADSASRLSVVDPVALAPQPESATGKILAIYGAKGGIGRTVLAVNLACALAPRCDEPVILVDADFRGGDVAVMLRVAPSRTVFDGLAVVTSSPAHVDVERLRSTLITHHGTGVLLAPTVLMSGDVPEVSLVAFRTLLETLRTMAAFVVVDLPAEPSALSSAVIDVADGVLALASMDMPSVKALTLGLTQFAERGVPMNKVRLVINRAGSQVKLDVADVERTVGLQAVLKLPSDVAVPRSVNSGIPAVLDVHRGDFADAVLVFAEQLLTAWRQAIMVRS